MRWFGCVRSEQVWSDDEVIALIQAAKAKGLLSPTAECDADLDVLDIGELERLVTVVQ